MSLSLSLSGDMVLEDGEAVKLINVTLIDDLDLEPSETFTLTLAQPTGEWMHGYK